MDNITYKALESGNIQFLKTLCNGLMKFQAEGAVIRPDVMASMNFENRLVPDFENAKCKHIVVAYDENHPVGFAFATVTTVDAPAVTEKPAWAEEIDGVGFYPPDYAVPKTVGTFKLLYVDSAYRGLHIGAELSDRIMAWLKCHETVEDLWVFVANGNEAVGKFYERYGFRHSHAVFGGFVQAYCQTLKSDNTR